VKASALLITITAVFFELLLSDDWDMVAPQRMGAHWT
jgi:hypothetical protein